MSTPTTGQTTAAKRASAIKTSGPAAAKAAPAAAASVPSSARSMTDHLAVLSEGDVMSPEGLHAFLESMRALTTGMAFFAEAASTQLEAAMRKGARDSADGRLTLADKAKLKLTLRRVNRDIEVMVKDALLDAARGSVKAYAHLETFLEELESAHVSRPHRNTRGGFSLFDK